METETEVIQAQAKGQLETQQLREAGRTFLELLRGTAAWPTPWFHTSNLQNCERIDFRCLERPSLVFCYRDDRKLMFW